MKYITTFFVVLFSVSLYAQGNFNVEWESPLVDNVGIGSFERTNSIPEILMFDYAGGYLRVYDGATKNLKYMYSYTDTASFYNFWSYVTSIPIDVNNDGVNEIGFVKSTGTYPNLTTNIRILNGLSGQILFQNTYYGSASLATIDVDGDTWIELCVYFRDYTIQKGKLIILSTTSHPIGIEPQSEQPLEYNLKQNYPNPFNPSTTIEYSISRDADVQIQIYNELGQLVNTLTEGQKNAGSHKVVLDGSNLASGVYFYQLVVDNVPETKKMVLVK